MRRFIDHVKRALKGEEKLWKIVVFWVFLGNLVWAQDLYIFYRVYPINQFFFVPHYVLILLLTFYIPFSIFLLWKNSKNSSRINTILARTGSAAMVVMFIVLTGMRYMGTHQFEARASHGTFKEAVAELSKSDINDAASGTMDTEAYVKTITEKNFGKQDD